MMKKVLLIMSAIMLTASMASSAIVEFTGQGGDPTIGGVETASNWAGGVVPFGGDVGRIANAVNVWTGGVLQNNAVRLEGGNFFAPLGLNMRGGTTGAGTTLLEVDTTDWASTTNVSITGDLVFWSQFGEPMNLNVLNGSVYADGFNGVAGPKGTINLGNGVINTASAIGTMYYNMLAGGSGDITIDVIGAGFGLNVDFASNNTGSFTLGARSGGISTAGVWEWFIANGMMSIDGLTTTNAADFNISYNGLAGTISVVPEPATMTLLALGGLLLRRKR